MRSEPTTYERALNLLAFRARSVAELRRKLRDKGAPAAEIETTLAKLLDQKLLNDGDFARQFARSKAQGGTSRLRILQELGRKGVGRDVAEAALSELADDEGIDPGQSIHRVAEKKWKTLEKLDDMTRRRRIYAFLARRGFNPDEIRSAIDNLGARVDTDEPIDAEGVE